MMTVKIKGMRCQHCVNATSRALEEIDGIANVRVDLEKGEATFDGEVSPGIIKEAIAKIGFEVVD
jgi:copper chaperone